MKKYMILACLVICIGSADRVLASGGSPKYICKETIEHKNVLVSLAVPATYYAYKKLCEYIPAEYLWVAMATGATYVTLQYAKNAHRIIKRAMQAALSSADDRVKELLKVAKEMSVRVEQTQRAFEAEFARKLAEDAEIEDVE